MRKLFALVLTLIIVLSLAACGQSSENSAVKSDETAQQAQETVGAADPMQIDIASLYTYADPFYCVFYSL